MPLEHLERVCEEDTDFVGDSSRKSTTGFCIKLIGLLGTFSLLDWKSMLQKSISLSTAEAEIVAFRDALERLVSLLGYLEPFFGRMDMGAKSPNEPFFTEACRRTRAFLDRSDCGSGRRLRTTYFAKSH